MNLLRIVSFLPLSRGNSPNFRKSELHFWPSFGSGRVSWRAAGCSRGFGESCGDGSWFSTGTSASKALQFCRAWQREILVEMSTGTSWRHLQPNHHQGRIFWDEFKMPLSHPICFHQFLSRIHPIEYASLQIGTSEVWVQRTQGKATETDSNSKGGESVEKPKWHRKHFWKANEAVLSVVVMMI